MNAHEKINYVEFPAKDILVVKSFFRKVFDWIFINYGPGDTSFSDKALNGGSLHWVGSFQL